MLSGWELWKRRGSGAAVRHSVAYVQLRIWAGSICYVFLKERHRREEWEVS